MEIKCYWDDNIKQCPYKKYIEEFFANNEISSKKKLIIQATIKNKFDRMKFCNDIKCIEELSKNLSPHEYYEIRLEKNSQKLIRITLYYDREEKRIVILDGFEKPNKLNYNQKEKYDCQLNLNKSDYYLRQYKKSKKCENYD